MQGTKRGDLARKRKRERESEEEREREREREGERNFLRYLSAETCPVELQAIFV